MGKSCLPGYPCSGPASVPALGGHFPCSIPWAGSQTWLSELPPEPVAQHLLCAESQGGKGLASCQETICFYRHLRHGVQVGFAVLHLCHNKVAEFVFGQIYICTEDIMVQQQGEGLWTNHHTSHEPVAASFTHYNISPTDRQNFPLRATCLFSRINSWSP